MFNKTIICGRLTADPELKQTPSNVAVVTFNVAVERDYKGADGNRETDFIPVVAWRNTAEFICKYFTKGKPIIIDGRIQTRSYDDKDGNRRNVVEVLAEAAKFTLSDGTRAYTVQENAHKENTDFEEMFEVVEDGEELPF